jgi:two-component system chemotaxis sensor kinase CheA
MDVSQYLEIFLDESNEHLQTLSDQLIILEKEPDNSDTINEIFRAAHSLKGMAGTMGYKRMQNLTHDMENVFSEVRNGNMEVNSNLVDVLFQCLDALETYVDNIRETQDEGTDDNEPIIKALNAFIASEGKGNAAPAAKKEEAPAATASAAPADDKDMPLADFEKNAVNEALKKNLHVYKIKVSVDENCILKAARAFLVFKNLEGHGDIIKSEPSVQDIEDEKFDFDFSIIVVTEEKYDNIIALIKNVSEIKDAAGQEITQPFPEEQTEEAKEEKKETSAVSQTAKPAAAKPAAKKPTSTGKTSGSVSHTVRVDIEKLDVLMNLVSELIIAKNGLVSASHVEGDEAAALNQSFTEQIEYLERVTTNLHESVMKVRMMPIESVFSRFPRMIRDLNKKLGKKMELYMSGEDTELDRTVIDEIGDPIMHLLRNSADHGLESAEIRKERGKSEVGSIFLDAFQEGNNVVIEVRDDGNGIDTEKVKAKAVEKGTITQEQADVMTDKEAIDLLFRPSFSTAEKVTDVSGRGVGLDVVKSKIEALGGDVEVKTKYGEGSTFSIRLPLTLAIIQALMVKLGDEKYAISLGSIETIEDIPVSDIK